MSNPRPTVNRPGLAFAYYPPDYHTNHAYVVGRHVATESFFRAWLKYALPDPIWCYSPSAEHYAAFKSQVRELCGAERRTVWLSIAETPGLAAPGALFRSDPRIGELAWMRRHGQNRAFSIVGVVHTLVDSGVLDGVGRLVTAPVESWDAVVCTSRAAVSFMRRMLEGYTEYLAARFGTELRALPLQLPVIPLGVDCDALAPSDASRSAGRALRVQLGIGADDVVVLFLGRISFLDKAHPMPMYLGLEQAARGCGKRLHLLQVGQFSHPEMKPQFVEVARAFCPSVNCLFLDSRDPERRHAAWSAADIFTSLPDSVQETFGQTPIEAMAAGLPAVVSDWDGYRDSVVHGKTGFLAGVTLPAAGAGRDLAFNYEIGQFDYGAYLGSIGLATAVDVAACARHYETLIGNPDLRHEMGSAARQRAEQYYDWRVVIGRYQDLLRELSERRQRDAESCPGPEHGRPNPMRPDPFWLYAEFAAATLRPDDVLAVSGGAGPELDLVLRFAMNNYVAVTRLPAASLRALMADLAAGPKTVAELLAAHPKDRSGALQRSLCWLLKMGLVVRRSGT